MSHARLKENWWETASLLAMLRNVNIDPKKNQPLPASFFNPFVEKPKPKPMGWDPLKAMFAKPCR